VYLNILPGLQKSKRLQLDPGFPNEASPDAKLLRSSGTPPSGSDCGLALNFHPGR
jgi:hypothetical protein